ncbi:MAG: DUF3095 family protein [Gammaproteobacteria bacterium]|nr:DUF3095 family protein [Gammaproteobacteria bacterium]
MPDFYEQLNIIEDFLEVSNDELYKPIPESWLIVITDVKGSTKALDAGRYKEVNTLGAATVALIQGILETLDFPFVFGGDGASMALSPSHYKKIFPHLPSLKEIALQRFDLELRVGVVKMTDLIKMNAIITMARLKIYQNRTIALFSGGGLKLADSLIKQYPEKYEITQKPIRDEINLNNLSCRWNPIPSQKGQILSILIDSDSSQVYSHVLKKIKDICGGDFLNVSPVHIDTLTYKGFFECIKEEYLLHRNLFSKVFIQRLKDILISVFLFKMGKYKSYKIVQTYHDHLSYHTDYKKFDDTLRLILDCTDEQIEKIESLLKNEYEAERLFYGTHKSDSALMTCLVQTISDGEHIHFIDGNNGGYTAAAKTLKQQIKESKA